MKLNKLTIKTEKIEKILWLLASRAFFVISLLILASLILGAILFYKYIVLVERTAPQSTEKVVTFEYSNYQNVLEALRQREEKLTILQGENHSNPFK